MQVSFSPADLIALAQPRKIIGSTTDSIHGIAALDAASPGDLTFLGNAKYRSEVPASRGSVFLLPEEYEGEPGANQLFLLVDNPSAVLSRFCAQLERLLWPKPVPGVHPSASVSPSAKVATTAAIGPLCVVEDGAIIGERSHLQAQVFVGRNARVGDDCWLMPGVAFEAECVAGNRVRLHPGVVVGADGFGYEFVAGHHEKVPQVGIVLLEDDVEIGANSTIDRARFSRTVVGEGTKIDNLVQIGHNVVIGKHCLLCSQVGISGSTTLGDYVVLGGQVGVAGHITVAKGVKAGGQAGINSDVAAGSFINGTPAIPYMLERRIAVLQHRLPQLFKRVDALEAQLKKSSS